MPAKTPAQMLLEMPPTASDRFVALLLADKCIELTDKPYRFAINHDIRPPKNLACPLGFDWSRKDRVGIEWEHKLPVRQWLTKALQLGYTVYYMGADREVRGFPHSIAIARRRAALHQMPKVDYSKGEHYDDIPF